MKYPIFIPTHNRVDNQRTLKLFTPDFIDKHVSLVVGPLEWGAHGLVPVLPVPNIPAQKISTKRQYILDHAAREGHDWFFMVDDDVQKFTFRREDRSLERLPPERVHEMFEFMESLTGPDVGFVSVCFRFMQQQIPEDVKLNTGSGSLNLWNVRALKENDIRFDAIEFMEDIHVHLSLLEHGFNTVSVRKFITENLVGKNPGGNSGDDVFTKRAQTTERIRQLHRMHPRSTKLTEEPGIVVGRESDVTIQFRWAEAAKIGKSQTLF